MTERSKGHRWEPITDVMAEQRSLRFPELDGLIAVFGKRRGEMEGASALREFQARLVRSWSIETGILERLYTLSDSATLTLLEQGFDAALLSHGDSDLPPEQLVTILRDHQDAAEGLFEFVKGGRPLTTSYVKQLHQVFTRHQPTCDAVDGQGNWVQVPLRRGEWKLLPNNPGDVKTGEVWHQYSPPEQVASEMDRLIALHGGHGDVHYVVEAAWLHHRFAQIHPFQDGNGRVARALASLVCIRGGGFPVVVMREQKAEYIRALGQADKGDLSHLVAMFERQQVASVLNAVGVSEAVLAGAASLDSILSEAKRKLERADRMSRVLAELLDQFVHATKARLDDVGERVAKAVPLREVKVALPPAGFAAFQADTKRLSVEHGYEASFAGVVAEIGLMLRTSRSMSMIVVAIHQAGRVEDGVGAALAFLSSAGPDGRAEAAALGIVDRPFTFTAERDHAELLSSYSAWLERAVARGLDLWQRGL